MRFAVIDLANLFGRCAHVVQGDAFTKAGMTLHIVLRSLKKLHQDMKADHFVFCVEGRSWRYGAYPDYKIHRRLERESRSAREKEEMAVMAEVQKEFVDFLAEKTRCTVLQSEGVEGDDFVARWVQLHPDDEHLILSGDSDFVQLLAPNVTLMDGVQERFITVDGVVNFAGETCVFNVDPSSGKIKVPGTIEECRKKHDKAEKEKAKKTPGYEPKPFAWEPPSRDEEWWKRALFIKCIRGDSGDSIFSAYPGVRYEGSSKKTGIREAWEDRNVRGYNWNNFMLSTWERLKGVDAQGKNIVEKTTVRDALSINESLIDLTKQPDDVKALMDEVILQAVQKEPVKQVGLSFIRFCNQHDLPRLQQEAQQHAAYLGAPYGR
jgi:hypothetical protein